MPACFREPDAEQQCTVRVLSGQHGPQQPWQQTLIAAHAAPRMAVFEGSCWRVRSLKSFLFIISL